jgi:peptidoglycan/xylan/chitin deacetylase (PgdA/CDA1 family)
MSLRERSLLLQARIAEERARRSATPAGIALVYHRVADRTGERTLELSPAVGRNAFRAELDYLQHRYDVVAPSSLLDAARDRGSRLPVAITFDDDTHSHIDDALPALGGVTAAFFVAGWSLHGDGRPWWELLQLAVDHGRFERGAGGIGELGREVEQLEPAERRALEQRLAESTADLRRDRGLGRAELALLAGQHEIGFHTRGHYRLSRLGDDQLATELADGRDVLAEAIGRPVDAIAYPHGDADDRVRDAARAAGYSLGFAGRNRALTADADPLLLPRLDPSHASLGVFALTLARASLSA